MFQRFVQWGSIGLLVLAAGCGSSNRAAAEKGGISGGGGNALAGKSATADDFLAAGKSFRGELEMIFKGLSFRDDLDPVIAKLLFENSKTILQVVNRMNVAYATDRPCYENGGEERDASIYPPNNEQNSICVSLPRLVGKYSRDEARGRLLPLIAHEFSHLVGATEAQAVAVQDLVSSEVEATARDAMVASAREMNAKLYGLFFRVNEIIPQIEKAPEDADFSAFVLPVLNDFWALEGRIRLSPHFASLSSSEVKTLSAIRQNWVEVTLDSAKDRKAMLDRLNQFQGSDFSKLVFMLTSELSFSI